MNSCGPVSATTPAFCTNEVAQVTEWLWTFSICCKYGSRAGDITESPAGHGIRLGETIEDQRSLGHAGQRGDAGVSMAVVEDLLVHLVREDQEIVLPREVRDGGSSASSRTRPVGLLGELMSRMRAAGVHRGRASPASGASCHPDREQREPASPGELDHRPVGDPGRLGNQHVDSGLDEGQRALRTALACRPESR